RIDQRGLKIYPWHGAVGITFINRHKRTVLNHAQVIKPDATFSGAFQHKGVPEIPPGLHLRRCWKILEKELLGHTFRLGIYEWIQFCSAHGMCRVAGLSTCRTVYNITAGRLIRINRMYISRPAVDKYIIWRNDIEIIGCPCMIKPG